jgi:GAF domain
MKMGWGHGSIEYVTDIAIAADVKQLVIFHHDPQRTDDQVEELVELAQKRAENAGSSLKILAAADRAEFCLPKKEGTRRQESSLETSAKDQPMGNCNNQNVFICHDNEGVFSGCKEDNIKMSFARVANDSTWGGVFKGSRRRAPPTMFVISSDAKYQDCGNGVDLCRKIRDEYGNDIPVLLIAKNCVEKENLKTEADDQGVAVTDWMVAPTPAYLRTRMRMAIARNPCRWIPPEKPKNELQRLDTLRALKLSETPEERYDTLVKLVKTAMQVETALLNLVDEDYQWTKSCPMMPKGMPRLPRDLSFCGHAILQDDLMIVNDTLRDNRFADNPLVKEGMKLRFYAGCPISIPSARTGENYNVGTLCLASSKPRKLTEHEQDMFRQFGALARRELLSSGIAKGGVSIEC